jgi:uncharacterized protein (TIGR03435 family)
MRRLLAALMFLTIAAPAQSRVAFEVASIKEHKAEDRQMGYSFLPGGRLSMKGLSLQMVIATAYNLPFQTIGVERLTGVPEWAKQTRYDIEAAAEKGAIPEGQGMIASREKIRAMLQTLLAERFKLVIRRDTKELPAYLVIVGKNGVKLPKSDLTEKDCEARAPSFADGNDCHGLMGGMGRGLHGNAATIADAAAYATNWADRPIIDKTGIAELYKFETDGWVSMRPPPPSDPNHTPSAEELAAADPARPTLFQIFDRMGLKLESGKAPIDIYVVEGVQRPSEN